MVKKCKACSAPLEGFLFCTIGRLFGLKESKKKPGLCNKCEAKPAASKAKPKKSVKKK